LHWGNQDLNLSGTQEIRKREKKVANSACHPERSEHLPSHSRLPEGKENLELRNSDIGKRESGSQETRKKREAQKPAVVGVFSFLDFLSS
jgi:hypothetical protein